MTRLSVWVWKCFHGMPVVVRYPLLGTTARQPSSDRTAWLFVVTYSLIAILSHHLL